MYGLITLLYNEVSSYGFVLNKKEFVETLVCLNTCVMNSEYISAATNRGYYPKKELLRLKELFNKEQDQYLQLIDFYFSPFSNKQKDNLRLRLIDFLNLTTTYVQTRGSKNLKEKDLKYYDIEKKNQLISYYKYISTTEKEFNYNIYLYLYFAVLKELPVDFYFGRKYRNDRQEFVDEILCKYGVVSAPGQRAIIEYSFKGNSVGNLFALCEYADMLFYGYNPSHTPDYPKAIEIYQIASGLQKTEGSENFCHPLALFSLAYIYFNYHRRGYLKDVPNIDLLEMMTPEERLEKSILYSNLSIAFNPNGSSYNNLGNISNALSPEERIKYQLNEPYSYYQKAIEHDYVYGYNNLAVCEAQLIITDPANGVLHLNNYLSLLQKAADKYEPWANYMLGLFYLHGFVNSIPCTYPEHSNKELALQFFSKAFSFHLDENSARAAFNVIQYYADICKRDSELYTKCISVCIDYGSVDLVEDLLEFLGHSKDDFFTPKTSAEYNPTLLKEALLKHL